MGGWWRRYIAENKISESRLPARRASHKRQGSASEHTVAFTQESTGI